MAQTFVGTCFCGAVGIEATGEPIEMGYCHCASCRAYSGGPFEGYMLWKAENVRITRGDGMLGSYNKTGMSDRRFCTKCGGHLMTNHPTLGVVDVFSATLPTLAFKPGLHINYAETVLPMKDGLPKFKDFPGAFGGSDEHVPE